MELKYSFRKQIQNEYYSLLLFWFAIIPMIVFFAFIVFAVIFGFVEYKSFSMDILLFYLKTFFWLPVSSILIFFLLLMKIFDTKSFIKYCTEIDAKIEKYLAYYGKHNDSHEDGTETAILVVFSYEFNGIQYRTRYSIARNEKSIEYFDNYKEFGNTVKILVHKEKPWKMKIKELFL
jgi:hypothetical protein